jgi:hypothetical protein
MHKFPPPRRGAFRGYGVHIRDDTVFPKCSEIAGSIDEKYVNSRHESQGRPGCVDDGNAERIIAGMPSGLLFVSGTVCGELPAKEIESHDGMKKIAGLTEAGGIALIVIGSNDATAIWKTAKAKCELVVKDAKLAQFAVESRPKTNRILAYWPSWASESKGELGRA